MRVLLLGANGFLGRFVADRLLADPAVHLTALGRGDDADVRFDLAGGSPGALTRFLDAVHPGVVVNCAGIAPPAKVLDREGKPSPLDAFERIIRVNLIGTYNVIAQASAVMSRTEPDPDSGDRGVIVSTASVAAFDGQVGQPAYSASKGGVHAMTLPIARELARYGIRVVTIAPGIMETPMLAGLPQPAQDSLGEQVPYPARLGRPDEYARLVLSIVDNGYLNGETIRLDGAIRMAPK